MKTNKSIPALSRYFPSTWENYALSQSIARLAMHESRALCLTLVDPDNAAGFAFLDLAGNSGGYVTPQGEIAGLFRYPGSRRPVLPELVPYALGMGGWWLTCFAIPALVSAYEFAGFVPVFAQRWDDALAPKGWEGVEALRMRPPLVYMVHFSCVPIASLPTRWDTVETYAEALERIQTWNPQPTRAGAFLGGVGQTVAPSFASKL